MDVCYRCLRVALSLSLIPKLTVTLKNVSTVACLKLRSALMNLTKELHCISFYNKNIHC